MPVRIAIIDSGVHAAHPHVQGIADGIGIDDHGHLHDDYVDRLGHGTAVAAVIREKAPDAHLYAIKVFDRELRATAVALGAAIRWARGVPVDLINLSLGTANAEHKSALLDEVRAARAAGVLIVAAAPEAQHHWLPGALPDVIGVELDLSLARDICIVRRSEAGEVRMRASGYPRPIPGVPPERNLRGLSFAVANATGWLAGNWAERAAMALSTD